MESRFHIEKIGGKIAQQSREIFAEQIAALPDGLHTIEIHAGKRGYTPSRYKYYFSAVLGAILQQAGDKHMITNPATGEVRAPRNTTEIHEIMKAIYNPIQVMVGRIMVTLPGSTTDLSDSEFIGAFMDQIMSDYMSAPYLVDFVDYEIWKAMCKSGEWAEQKQTLLAAQY